MMKKILSIILVTVFCVSVLSGCNVGLSGDLKGAHVFMFKMTGGSFGTMMYEGFSQAISEAGGRPVNKSPSESTVAAQVELIDTLITQKVASITISTNGATGFDEVFRRAREAGISVISADSAASPDYRVTHIDQTDPMDVGVSLVQAAVLIVCRVDYPEDKDMDAAVTKTLENYDGEPIKIGILSANVDTPVQNKWIECMRKELERDIYHGKVDTNLEIKYGNDDPNESRRQADAFISEDTVDIIVAPTTVGMFAAGEALKLSGSEIKLTGLGFPSEMKSYMPVSPEDNAFDFICPYMMLWDVKELGAIAGAATLAATQDGFDGKIGSSFTYNGNEYKVIESEDGGTRVIALKPYIFYKGNMAEWIDKL